VPQYLYKEVETHPKFFGLLGKWGWRTGYLYHLILCTFGQANRPTNQTKQTQIIEDAGNGLCYASIPWTSVKCSQSYVEIPSGKYHKLETLNLQGMKGIFKKNVQPQHQCHSVSLQRALSILWKCVHTTLSV
jgi:hypothetical protein